MNASALIVLIFGFVAVATAYIAPFHSSIHVEDTSVLGGDLYSSYYPYGVGHHSGYYPHWWYPLSHVYGSSYYPHHSLYQGQYGYDWPSYYKYGSDWPSYYKYGSGYPYHGMSSYYPFMHGYGYNHPVVY